MNNIEQIAQPISQIRRSHRKIKQGIKFNVTKCPVMKAFNSKARIVDVYCGLWSCPRCAKHNARMWAWRVKIHVHEAGKPAYFWTLTMRGKYKTAEQGFKDLPRLWNTFRMIIQRKVTKWQYVAFVEGQPKRDYMPHFHIISMVKSPERLKDLAMQAGFGYEAKETLVTSQKAASYCAKYASKQSPKTPKSFRRVRCSRDWTKLPDYDGDPLIVRSKKETPQAYLTRVSDVTGVDLQTIYERWRDSVYGDQD